MTTFIISIDDIPQRGWAWAVKLGRELNSPYVGLGWGHDLDSAVRLAKKAIKQYQRRVAKT